jgi:hypothetical protein
MSFPSPACPYVQFLSPAVQILDRTCGACCGAHFWIVPAVLILFGQVPSLILATRSSSSSQNMECKLVLVPVCLSLSVLFPLCPCAYILASLVYVCVSVCAIFIACDADFGSCLRRLFWSTFLDRACGADSFWPGSIPHSCNQVLFLFSEHGMQTGPCSCLSLSVCLFSPVSVCIHPCLPCVCVCVCTSVCVCVCVSRRFNREKIRGGARIWRTLVIYNRTSKSFYLQ